LANFQVKQPVLIGAGTPDGGEPMKAVFIFVRPMFLFDSHF